MNRIRKIIVISGLIGLLALVRMYEYRFFYDPFMYFFEQAYQSGNTLNIPDRLFVNVFLRFLLNTAISLLILWVAFRNKGILKFAGLIYAAFFVVLFPLFVYLMHHVEPNNYLPAFYVRRFLAHPILILILLPAFFYYKLSTAPEDREK